MYQAFAELYDELMDDVDYESWADYYTRLLSIYGIRNGKICECACGTGGLTIPTNYVPTATAISGKWNCGSSILEIGS